MTHIFFQKQAMLVRQLEEELRMRMRGPSIEMQQQLEALFQENEHLQREIAILRDTIKVIYTMTKIVCFLCEQFFDVDTSYVAVPGSFYENR